MKYRFRTKPMRHQVKALKKFLKMGCGALFAEMGTGKTKVAIDWACALATKENRRLHALVLCPKSVLTVWPREIRKHDPWGTVPHAGVEWDIVGVDAAWRPWQYDRILLEFKPDIIIVDESSYIKSPGARRSKGAYLIAKRCRYRLIMSGTPIGKNILDLFSQYKVVDESIFGTSFSVFKREYAVIRAYKVVKWMRMKKLKRKIKPYTFVIKKSQCLDLPERTHEIIPITMSARTQKVYDELARQSIVEFEKLTVMTPLALTNRLRLRMLTSGWLKGDEYRRVGQEKKMQLEYHLEEMLAAERMKVGIFCNFKKELIDAAEAAKAAGYRVLLLHGGTPLKHRERAIDAFHRVTQPTVFIGQTRAGSMGIDLTPAAECIWYSPTPSLIDFLQGCDRYHRYGQTRKVTYYHFLMENTIDYATILSLIEKRKLEQEILADPSIIYRHNLDTLPEDWAHQMAALWDSAL